MDKFLLEDLKEAQETLTKASRSNDWKACNKATERLNSLSLAEVLVGLNQAILLIETFNEANNPED